MYIVSVYGPNHCIEANLRVASFVSEKDTVTVTLEGNRKITYIGKQLVFKIEEERAFTASREIIRGGDPSRR